MASNYNSYISVLKPGIIRGNIFNATAGYFLAATGNIRPGLYLGTMSGLALIVASGCVFNNHIDRDIDKKMARTNKRATATGLISGRAALISASLLGLLGTIVLYLFSNMLALYLALFGLLMYVVVYGIAKRRTVHGTVVGSVSGAIPPVVGYGAASGSLDNGAFLLFFVYALWQMPHFYAIAIYRIKDYAAAKIPVLPIVNGVQAAKTQTLLYIFAFTVAASLLSISGYAGRTFLAGVIILGILWMWYGFKGFTAKNDVRWGKQMFGLSLLVILMVDVVLALNNWLP